MLIEAIVWFVISDFNPNLLPTYVMINGKPYCVANGKKSNWKKYENDSSTASDVDGIILWALIACVATNRFVQWLNPISSSPNASPIIRVIEIKRLEIILI